MIDLMFKWQGLIGAIIGAGAPILLFLFTKEHMERKEHRLKLLKILISGINNVAEIHRTLKKFTGVRLKEYIKVINEETNSGRYFVGQAYFPLFATNTLNDELFNFSTGSGYIDQKIILLIGMSKDFSLSIEDARRQFEETLEINRTLALEKVNSPQPHNEQFKSNITEFCAFLERDLFSKNTFSYFKALVEAHVALETMHEMGLTRWYIRFNPKWRLFINKKRFNAYLKINPDKIDKFLKDKTDKQMNEWWKSVENQSVPEVDK